MTKTEFHSQCERHEGGSNPGMEVKVAQVHREFDEVVELRGVWCNCSILDIELYRPMPANQHKDYAKCQKVLECERIKYARWLAEWLKVNGYRRRTIDV